MSYPIRITAQLKQHLRALRKSRGLTQAQLGALVGVKQARIAEIEANPGAVSLDQLTKVLVALGGTLHLHRADTAIAESRERSGPGPSAAPATPRKVATSSSPPSGQRRTGTTANSRGRSTGSPVGSRSQGVASKPSPRAVVVIRPKKGSW